MRGVVRDRYRAGRTTPALSPGIYIVGIAAGVIASGHDNRQCNDKQDRKVTLHDFPPLL